MFNLRQIVSLFCLVFLSLSVIAAQEKADPAAKNIVTGGIVNGKANSLVQPVYPLAAKAVHASGVVNVQVLIDENGDVVSASAVSGHPLLRAAAVQAARASRFSPTQLNGQPVRVSGIIVYNFVGGLLMDPAQIGYALALAAFSPKIGENFPAYQILNSFPEDWTDEKKQVEGLISKQNQEKAQNANKGQQIELHSKVESVKAITIIGARNNNEFQNKPHAEIAESLTALLRKRYASSEIQHWSFELGLGLGKVNAQIDDDAALRLNLNYLNQIVSIAPNTVPADLINEIKSLAALSEKAQIEKEDKDKIEALTKRLRFK